MSLVEVSPSTETMLKVSSATHLSAFWSRAGEMAASVVTKQSMVAILGWIIPEPLAMPPIVQVLPPSGNRTATSLRLVSVVMIASAASALPVSEREAASAGMAEVMGASGSGWPITPVDATITSSDEIRSAAAALPHMAFAMSTPSALQVLALPELQRNAFAWPSFRCACVTRMGAPLTLFCV